MIREILVVTSTYAAGPYTLLVVGEGGGGGVGERESGVSPSGEGVCYILLAGNRTMQLCNRRFSWREIVQEMACPLWLRSKTCLL